MEKHEEIKKKFEDNQDAEEAISMSKYIRNKFDFFGIPSQKRKEITKKIIKK